MQHLLARPNDYEYRCNGTLDMTNNKREFEFGKLFSTRQTQVLVIRAVALFFLNKLIVKIVCLIFIRYHSDLISIFLKNNFNYKLLI